MKPFWKAQARRIDALSLRERAIMFVSIAAALVALADALVLSPSIAERRRLAAQMREQTLELDGLRARLGTGPASDTPQGRQRTAIAAARAEQAAVDADIRQLLAGRDEIARLPEVLDRLLRRHERLTLTRLATVADLPASPTAAVRWQGVDLSVAGSYPDLVQYLAELERAMPGLRWGGLQIAVPSQPPVLTVRLMLPGEAP